METGFFTGRTKKGQTFQEAVHHLERTEVGYNSTLSKLLEQKSRFRHFSVVFYTRSLY